MLGSISKVFEDFGKRLGIKIKLPTPSEKTMNFTNILNTIVGGVLILLGFVSKKSWLGTIGAIAVVLNCIFRRLIKGR